MPVDMPITSFGGNSVGSGTSYNVRILTSNPVSRGIDVAASARRNRPGVLDAVTYSPIEMVVHIIGDGTATARATWLTNVEQWFSPWSSATRQLVATWHDGATSVYMDVLVTSLRKIQDAQSVPTIIYECVMRAEYPMWKAVTPTVSASDPATVTNAGNAPALPLIELTQATHKTLRAATVSFPAGISVTAYPIRFSLASATATSTNVFVYVNGVSAPCLVLGGGTGSSVVWALVDCAPDGSSTPVDIIYGTGITNPLCGQLADPEMFSATSGNDNWRWNDWTITAHAFHPGSWVPTTSGYHGTTVTYQLTSDGSAAVFDLLYSGTSDYDSMYVAIPAGTDGSLGGLSRVTVGLDGSRSQAFVRTRTRSSDRWTTSWSTRANATVTSAISITTERVAIVAGIENDGGAVDLATVTFDASPSAGIDLNNVPTVSIAAAANVDYYNGTYVVGGYTLTFTDCFAPDGTLSINCEERTITSSASGSIYNVPKFSDPSLWAALLPGSNTITDGISATDVITHRGNFT